MTITTRFMIMQNAGFGNPNQYNLMDTFPHGQEANFDLSAINVNDMADDFVVFARSKKMYSPENPPQLNSTDIHKLAEFIYEVLLKKFCSRPLHPMRSEIRMIVELDFHLAPDIFTVIMNTQTINPSTAGNISTSPMTVAFFNEIRRVSRATGRPITVNFVPRCFTPDECKAYFFTDCDKCNTDHCCKK